MLIDWFTVVAQIINFIILVALLKYFLYDRIIKAMDEREEKIKSRLVEAENKKQEASDKAEELEEKNRELDKQRDELLSEAREQADARKKELVQQARQETDNLKAEWQKSIEKEKEAFLNHMQEMVSKEVFAVTRRALGDLADEEIEERAVEGFLNQVDNMKKEEREGLVDSVGSAKKGLLVRSAFEMSSTLRQKTTRALHKLLSDDLDVEYEEDPHLIFGIELRTPDHRLAWNADDYLEELQHKAREELEKQAHQRASKEKDNGEPADSEDKEEKTDETDDK